MIVLAYAEPAAKLPEELKSKTAKTLITFTIFSQLWTAATMLITLLLLYYLKNTE